MFDVPAADLRRQLGPHVFVDDLDAIELTADDRHHLERTLRLRDGDPFTVSDGAGRWRNATFGPDIEAAGDVIEIGPPRYRIALAIALTKAAKPEFAVQKATELGVDHIIVFAAAHSVARWDEQKRAKNLPRLQRVAREAAMQSHRVTIPVVDIVDDLAALVATRRVVRADFGGIATNSEHRFVVVGPEGGWSESERALVPTSVDLGPTVLRAETAAVVASTFLSAHRGSN